MSIETLDLDGFLNFLKEKQGEQTAKQFAGTLGVSPQYLSDVYSQRTPPSEKITRALNANSATVFYVDTSTTEKEKP